MRLCSPGSPPRSVHVHPHPHTRVGAHPTCMCALPHTCTRHMRAQYTMGTRVCCVRVTCTAHIRHIHHPCAHAAVQPCTCVFPSPLSARLSLPCAASSPGLVSVCMEAGGGGSMRTRSSPHPLGGYRGVQGCGGLQKDQVFPTPAGWGGEGGRTGMPRVPDVLPSILAQEPRFPGSCKPDTDLVMNRGVQYLLLHKTTRQATNDCRRAALVSTPSLLAGPPPTRPAPQGLCRALTADGAVDEARAVLVGAL